MEMYDLIILGGGVAGMTAGLYAARGQINVVLFEKNAPGGQMLSTDSIENYPGIEHIEGFELGTKIMQHAQKFGLPIKYEGATEINLFEDYVEVKTQNDTYKTKYLIFATGSNPRKLGVPGEAEFAGKGVSYCATCDGAFFRDKECIVFGGGNSALDEGIALTKYATKVTIAHRRDEFTAEAFLQTVAKNNEKIEFLMNHEVKEIRGNEGKVDRVLLFNNKTNEEYEKAVEGVFVFVGYTPNSELMEGKVELERGQIITDINMKASHPRVYAAGDIRLNAVKQVISSGGDGATAAIAVMHALRHEK
ncbi:FAD-dependent oxidoreductase [Patescibacteria group bacterium]|nr:FAD-dependent oxidoreductase [Patescibacteria group bacterium]